jgi:hypothetical protein
LIQDFNFLDCIDNVGVLVLGIVYDGALPRAHCWGNLGRHKGI